MNTPTLMRSHIPIYGVGVFADTPGASMNVNAPKSMRTMNVTSEYHRNDPPSPFDDKYSAKRKMSCDIAAKTRCIVSDIVPPPAASTSRKCMGAKYHRGPVAE